MNLKKAIPVLILGLILSLSLILRTSRLEHLAGFDYDQETAAMWVRNLLVNRHFSLIGQETSVSGVFVGPFFYYLLAPFYLLFGGDPLGGNILVTMVSVLTTMMIYVTGKELFKTKAALLATFLYAFSFRINFYDRTVAPSNLVMFLSVLLFLSVWKVRHSKPKWLLAIFFAIGLGASVHPAILLYAPLCLFLVWQSRLKVPRLLWLIGGAILILFISPLILFEIRHGFSLSRSVLKLFSSQGVELSAFLFRLGNNWETILRGIEDAFLTLSLGGLALAAFFFLFLSKKRLGDRERFFLSWVFWPLTLLSLYPRGVPEYYFMPILSVSTIFLSSWTLTIMKNSPLVLKLLLILIVAVANLSALAHYNYPVSLAFKKQAVDHIAVLAGGREVAIHYSTDKGQKNGFAYLLTWYSVSQLPNSTERYRIVVPAENVEAPGRIFGSIKVIKE